MKIPILVLHFSGLLANSHQHLLNFGMMEGPPHSTAKNSTGFEDEPYQGNSVEIKGLRVNAALLSGRSTLGSAHLEQPLFLSFGMFETPPHFMVRNTTNTTSNQTFHGSWVDSIEWLSRRLNFSYKFIKIKDVWTEKSERLQRGDFDVLGPPVVMIVGRMQLFDYVGVFEDETSALLTPPLAEESSILSTIRPFQPKVWLMVLISLLAAAIYFSASSRFNRSNFDRSDMNTKSFTFGDYVLYATAILTNQGPIFWQPNHQSRISFRLTAGVWCLFALVMVNVYSSTLTAHITARKTSPPPKDAIEVMEKGVLNNLVLADGFGRQMILSATSGPIKKMGDIFRRHPEFMVPNQETAFRQVASGCCAYNDLLNFLKFRVGKDYKETGKCRVYIGEPVKGYGFTGLLIRKKNFYRMAMNQAILELYQTGLVGHWREKYFFGNTPCDSNLRNRPKKLRRLNLRDLASAFFILGIGVLMSLLLFFAEQFRRLKSQVKKSRNQ